MKIDNGSDENTLLRKLYSLILELKRKKNYICLFIDCRKQQNTKTDNRYLIGMKLGETECPCYLVLFVSNISSCLFVFDKQILNLISMSCSCNRFSRQNRKRDDRAIYLPEWKAYKYSELLIKIHLLRNDLIKLSIKRRIDWFRISS